MTQPDKKSGRHLKIAISPVKKETQKLLIPIYQPADISGKDFVGKLKSFNADFFVVVGFGRILTKEILDIPRFCCLNIEEQRPSNGHWLTEKKKQGLR